MKLIFMPILLLAALASGQHWDFERVDSAGWGTGLQMLRHPDGRMFLCYEKSASGQVRLAWKDTSWHYEDVPAPTPATDGEPRFAFAPDGTIGVTYTSQPRSWLSRRVDSTWIHTPLPASASFDWWATPVTFDSAGRPTLAVGFDPDSGGWVNALGLLRLVDTTWVLTDTLDLGPRGPVYNVVGFGTLANGSLWGTYTTYVFDVGYLYMDIRWFKWQGGWQFGAWFGGERAFIVGAGGAVDGNGTVHASFNGSDSTRSGFFYDSTAVSDEEPRITSLALDTANRPFIAYAVDSVLKFCFSDARGWHFFDVGVDSVTGLDVLAEPNGAPVIAFATPDGVFLARGTGITDVEETMNDKRETMNSGATIVRGVLFVPRSLDPSISQSLLDISGRKVLTLRSGANDVSALVPGVYFVRPASSVVRDASRVLTKVVIAR